MKAFVPLFLILFFGIKASAEQATSNPKYQCAVYKTYLVADPDLCKDICVLQSGPYQVRRLVNKGTGGYMYSDEGRAHYIVELKGENQVTLDFTYFGGELTGLKDATRTFFTQKESVSISLNLKSSESKAGQLVEIKLVCGP